MKREITQHEWKIRQAVQLLDLAGGDIPKASRLADQRGIAIDSAQWRATIRGWGMSWWRATCRT